MESASNVSRLSPAVFAETVGSAALARRLMETLGGHRIPRLSARRVSRETRDENIRKFFEDHGNDEEATAVEFGLSVRHVLRILNGL